MKTFKRILKWTGILVLLLLVITFCSGVFLYNKKYDAPYPDLAASKDTAVIAHGKHLVFATAHCSECHFKPGDSIRSVNGEEFALSGGGFPFEFPGGAFYASNISSDNETGIGKLTDAELARTFRYGVRANGKVLIPAMEFQNLSDEDIVAIISYLRTIPAVSHKVPENDLNLLGKAILAFFIRPEYPKGTPPAKVTADTSAEYGKYIASHLSNCKGCHTYRNPNTGAYEGEELAGGVVEKLRDNSGRVLVAPNLTPDPETGRIYNWNFEQFSKRFSQGKLIPQSIMPWGQFKNLNETELKAIWNYLQTVNPIHKDVGPPIQEAQS